MNIDLKFLEPYLIYIVGGFITLLILYLRSFFQESGKIAALKLRNKELVEETESIKKNHQLDIEKRKYQYESKKEQYVNFFKLIDKFTREANKSTQEKLMPILDEFNKNYLNAASQNNKRNETKAVTVMSKKMQKLAFEANEDLIKIKQETNTIKLIASDEILNKLNLMELAYDKNMEKSNKMMSDLPRQMMINDQEGMKRNQREIEVSGLVIQGIKDDIIKLMRKELNEI
ncbi:hypothetical protein ACE939_04060 [Aquimarina sp. W85]|uniref:hypothetical protein n=1 Tax=Aquimarina rhodophyticola TaxID=3342246 RepID=UPI00366CFE57